MARQAFYSLVRATVTTAPRRSPSRTYPTMAGAIPAYQLNSGHDMPLLGLGTWKSKPGEVEAAVESAIDAGYRHIDCAYIYRNENEVGQAIKAKIEQGKVTRGDLFVTSKLWNTRHRPEDVKPHLKESLEKLGLEYLDLYLIHWPQSYKPGDDLFPKDDEGLVIHVDIDPLDTWKALEACVDEGLVRSIGLSNFNSVQIDHIVNNGRIKPAALQVEIHPYLSNDKLVQHCFKQGIAVTAYSPLGSPDRPWASPDEPTLLEDPKLRELAKKHGKSPAQVVLRWLVQRGIIVIPKSVNPGRIAQNMDIFDFVLSAEDMDVIHGYNKNFRFCKPYIQINGKRILQDNVPHFPFSGVEY